MSAQQFFQGSLVRLFCFFDTMVDNSNIEKLTMPFFPGKFISAQIWAKRAQNGRKIGGFFYLLKNFMLVFLENNLDRELILLLIFDQHIWQNFGS